MSGVIKYVFAGSRVKIICNYPLVNEANSVVDTPPRRGSNFSFLFFYKDDVPNGTLLISNLYPLPTSPDLQRGIAFDCLLYDCRDSPRRVFTTTSPMRERRCLLDNGRRGQLFILQNLLHGIDKK